MAARITIEHGARLTLVHAYSPIIPVYPELGGTTYMIEEIARGARAAMDKALDVLRPTIPDVTGVVREGSPHDEILAQAAESQADLIVMGTHGHRGISRLVLGSEAEKVLRTATVPVLTVRAEMHTAAKRAA